MQQCKRCLYSDDILGVTIGESGQCSFCDLHDRLEKQYPISWADLAITFQNIKDRGKGHKYDCLVGISGGKDSSFLLHLCHVYGARAMALHFDNGFNTEQAESNMGKMLAHTGYKCQRVKIDPDVWRDVNAAVLMAGVSDTDIPNDLAMAKLLLEWAHICDCPTILNGHNFRTEGSVPIGWTYMDAAYLKDMYRKYHGKELPKNFPVMNVWDQVKASIRGIQQVSPLYHLGLTKADQVKILESIIDFRDYKGHHTENDYTSFAGWMTYRRYNIDKRIVVLSAQIRSGKITRREAKIALSEKPTTNEITIQKVLDILTLDQLHKIPFVERKMFYEFRTHQKTFRRWRLLIKLAVKMGLMRETFYKKYTQRINVK